MFTLFAITGGCFASSCVVPCWSLFVFLSVFFWSLYCLSFDLRLLIIPSVSWKQVWRTRQFWKLIMSDLKYLYTL